MICVICFLDLESKIGGSIYFNAKSLINENNYRTFGFIPSLTESFFFFSGVEQTKQRSFFKNVVCRNYTHGHG